MAEERTAEEREAARLERERRRAAKAGVELPQAVPSAPAPPPPEPEPEPMAPPEPGPEPVASPEPELEPIAPPEPEAITPPEPDPEPEPIASPEPEPDPEPDPEAIAPPEPEPEPEPIAPKPRARVVRSRAPRRPRRPRRPPREPGRHSRRTRIAAAIALVLAAAVVWFCVELFQPFHGSGSGSVIVTIPAHSSASRVGGLLARDGVISSSFFFQLRATLGGERDDLRAGTYRLKHGMSYGTALSVLTNPPPAAKVTEVTIVPGHTRAQVNALLHAQGIAGSYLSATRSSPLLNPRSYGAPAGTASLEGFLFPDTYQVRLPISIPALVADQLTTFKQQFASVNLSYARHKNLTPYDVLIIASMIEGEASTAQDRTLVASVIYNRLRDNMPLQLDDTTRYATGNYTTPLTQAQVNSSSPYNTRIHMGLTPTPIDSPSLASIQAATHPANTNYLYFVVEPCGNGAMVFSANYAQFLRDQQRYNNARAAQGGRSPEKCS